MIKNNSKDSKQDYSTSDDEDAEVNLESFELGRVFISVDEGMPFIPRPYDALMDKECGCDENSTMEHILDSVLKRFKTTSIWKF
jgi:hypothetical protein